MTTFIVKTSAMPLGSGKFAVQKHRIAVLELNEGFTGAPMISERAKAVKSIVWLSEGHRKTGSSRCPYAAALAEANAECDRLNAAALERAQ